MTNITVFMVTWPTFQCLW